MNWLQVLVSVLCAVVAGFAGGCTVSYRMGQWRQKVGDRLDTVEARLEKGNGPVGMVPILDTRMEVLIEDVKEIKQSMRDWLPRLVTNEECNRRHGDGR